MPKFAYVAETRDGVVQKGVEKFDSLTAARVALLERDVDVLEVHEKRSWTEFEISKAKVKRSELMHLSRQLARLHPRRHPDPRRDPGHRRGVRQQGRPAAHGEHPRGPALRRDAVRLR